MKRLNCFPVPSLSACIRALHGWNYFFWANLVADLSSVLTVTWYFPLLICLGNLSTGSYLSFCLLLSFVCTKLPQPNLFFSPKRKLYRKHFNSSSMRGCTIQSRQIAWRKRPISIFIFFKRKLNWRQNCATNTLNEYKYTMKKLFFYPDHHLHQNFIPLQQLHHPLYSRGCLIRTWGGQ